MLKNKIFKHFKLVPDNVKKYKIDLKIGERLFVLVYYDNEFVVTCGYGKYIGVVEPETLPIYDGTKYIYETGKKYPAVQLSHNNTIIYSCEASFLKFDKSLTEFLKNRKERYIDVQEFRSIVYANSVIVKEEMEKMFNEV